MRTALAVLGLSLFLSAAPLPAHADARTDLAAKLAAKVMPRQTWDKMMEAVWNAQAPLYQQMTQGKPDAAAKLAATFKERFAKLLPYEEMRDFQAGLLAKYYTADDLKALIRFYDSPVGQKSLSVMPQVTADAAAWTQQRLVTELPAMEQELAKQVGTEAAGNSK